ncbi:MAG: PLP-dependent aminotransferase family protein [Lachnospiraceae bacterium]|nr:PLP-dependent aminotransferase family protein [Lachnospiraceae bacterium]
MITVNLDRDSSTSLYIQLYESLKRDIIIRKLLPNEALPSKRALSEHLGISIKTIENAYSQLLLEGYIYSVEKKGYYVNALSDYRVRSNPTKPYVSKYTDEDYLVDLKANKNSMEMFPVSTWYRIMRETLSYDTTRLWDTVPFNGLSELRIAIARHLLDFRGMEVSPDQIIVGAGTEYLYARLIQLLGRDTSFAVEDPGYTKIRAIYHSNQVNYRAIPLDKNGIRIDLLKQSDCNVVHVSPAHHFPLGLVMPIARRLELLSWVNAQKDRYIIEDDYDSEYRYHGMPVPPLYNIDVRSKVIYMNTFSKCIAPAVRISFMVLPEALMERYLSTLSFYSCSVSSFDQFTLAKFIEGNYLERHINHMKRYYIKQRDDVIRSISQSSLADKTRIIEDAAGTHFLLKVNTSLSDEELISRLKEKKILISCLSEYCEHKNPLYESTLIVNYSGITPGQIRYFITELETLLQPYSA